MLQPDSIPHALKELPQWVIWKFETREGRVTKAPYQAVDPFVRASSTQVRTWATFAHALKTLETGQGDGLGFVFTDDDPFCGIDIDPDLEDDAQADIIERLASYTERSPSGRGYHVIIRAEPLDKGRHPPGIGIFTSGRYFTFTGDKLEESPGSVEWRQAELEEIVAEYLPAIGTSSGNGHYTVQPVDASDEELIEKARQARRGVNFDRLWRGEWQDTYSSQSEADLAFMGMLAFWTGRDAVRMDRIFRSSGLMRDKWEQRPDYRASTIEEAIAGCRDVYVLKRERGRFEHDELEDQPDTQPDTAPLRMKIVPLEDFAATEEEGAEELLGRFEDKNLAVPAGSIVLFFGDGGAGKTTLALDILFHLATGTDWLGLPVDRRIRSLWIENEGPRAMFRRKVDEKIKTWPGPRLEGNIVIPEEPWARFTFGEEAYREQLRAAILEHDVDIVCAGPVTSLGVQGGGTPEEVHNFIFQLELVRGELGRPITYMLIHHENKAGDVSGHWHGEPDTLIHVSKNSKGSTRVYWNKVRWGGDLQSETWQLNWRDGETFARDDESPVSDSDIEADILEYVGSHPGTSWRPMREAIRGQDERKAVVRDRMFKEGTLVNSGKGTKMELESGSVQTRMEED